MALGNKTTATPGFEQEDAPDVKHTPSEAPEATRTPTTAIAPKSGTAVASPLSAGTVLKQLQNAIPTVELESLGIGVFPRITVGTDGFSQDKTGELGSRIKFEVLSWSYVTLVTTGEQNNAEANKLIRTSYDGVNLKGGEGTVIDYVKYLKDVDGYSKACSKVYVEVYANLLEFEAKEGKTFVTQTVEPEDQQIMQISLSPQSVGQWGRFMLESGLRRAKGVQDTNTVVANQQKKVLGSNTFGIAIFSVN